MARSIHSIAIRYQPIISLTDGRACNIEVLARDIGPHGEIMGPENIVRAMTSPAESLGLTKMIMRRSLAEIAAAGFDPPAPCFGFNLPLDAMQHPGLIQFIERLRLEAGLPARMINFELTERHEVLDVPALGRIVKQLLHAGYELALDDVTPAMPNLAALLDLPINAIKLDHSVVNSPKRHDEAFIRRLVAHADLHRQQIVAEGIETDETWRRMRELGVRQGQGFLFSQPLCAADLKSFLAHQSVTEHRRRVMARS